MIVYIIGMAVFTILSDVLTWSNPHPKSLSLGELACIHKFLNPP
jgi:hypothetical protein